MESIRATKITTKVIVGFLFMLTLVIIMGVSGFLGIQAVKNELNGIIEKSLPSVDMLIETDRNLQRVLVAERSLIFANATSGAFRQFISEYEDNLLKFLKSFENYKKLSEAKNTDEIIAAFEKSRKEWRNLSRQIVNGRMADTRHGRRLAIDLSLQGAKQKFEEMRDHLESLTEINLAYARHEQKGAQKIFKVTLFILLGVMVFCVVLGLAILFILIRNIIQAINRVHQFAGRIKKGDLSARLPGGDDEIGEMGEALNQVVSELGLLAQIAKDLSEGKLFSEAASNLRDEQGLLNSLNPLIVSMKQIVQELDIAVKKVDKSAVSISNSSRSLSDGASQQAASLQEITSSMTEIGMQTEANAKNVVEANQLSGNARDAGENGADQMQKMINAMENISDSGKKIRNIINAIDGIAFQTNLLALNAAVEAARAGKHGKGFAVVAQEVRALAARSAKAAQETTALIEESDKNLEEGNQIAENTSEAIKAINEIVSKVFNIMDEIAVASNEQAMGVSLVNHGLNRVENITIENNARAEETSQAALELSNQAVRIKQLLDFFSGESPKQIMPPDE